MVNILPGEYTIRSAISTIEAANDLTFSFNSSLIDSTNLFSFTRAEYLLKDVLKYLFRDYQYDIISYTDERLVLRIESKRSIILSGIIYDKNTNDRIPGTLIEDMITGDIVYSNENGFYSMELVPGRIELKYRYLGYDNHYLSEVFTQSANVNIPLINNNELSPVIITSDVSEGLPVRNSGMRINPQTIHSFGSIAGVDDLINRVRYLPGVQSGNEGVGGLLVRGGSNDQNLYLYDGVPLYEISHTAGISSIFNNESIQKIEVYKQGFPAKYSGRLSSIVDVTIKEGNQNQFKSSLSVGNYGPNLNISGPLINQKLTFNLSARTSWMHFYINPLIGDVINYDDVNIRFTDLNFKTSWLLNPRHKITMTNYYGHDVLNLDNETTSAGPNVSFRLLEKNSIKWNTFLTSVNYVGTLNEKLQLSVHLGQMNYDYQNRGAYSFRKFSLDNAFVDEIDVISRSSIQDLMGGIKLEYFLNDFHLISVGSTITKHGITPTLRQSTILLGSSDIDQIGDNATEIDAFISSFYIQQKIRVGKRFHLDMGINTTNSSVRGTNYIQWQPRATASWKFPFDSDINFSYSRMAQFVHVLVNPGLGLPSNLWVPSTEKVSPESSDQINLSFNKRFGSSLNVHLDGYLKWSDGLIEYRFADGLYSTILNDSNFVPIFNEDKDWENNIETGKGTMRGVEMYIEGDQDQYHYWISYSLSRSTRTFANINEGEPFPFKYDRRHDINVGLVRKIKQNKSFGLNWVYGTGSAFTLALESFPSVDGIELLNPGARNNYRLPAFHHLDVFYEYQKRLSKTPYSIKIGIYNVYNQLNPYYVILYNDPVEERPILKQVSIFPIFPYVIFKTAL